MECYVNSDWLHPWDPTDITWYTLLSPCICILELGDGWVPVVINSPSELILIHKMQKRMYGALSYWIGGSTYVKHGEPVTFYDYMPNLSG